MSSTSRFGTARRIVTSRPPTRSRGGLLDGLGKPPRDDLRDAVAGHRDAVERVGGLHRALLVRDDDELGAVAERPQHLEEAVDVEVVERGLDLVEDVERARAGEEHREQERQRGHRLLAAGEQRQALGGLARGRDLDLDAELVLGRDLVVWRVVLGLRRRAAEDGPRARVLADEAQAAATAREEVLDDLLEVL